LAHFTKVYLSASANVVDYSQDFIMQPTAYPHVNAVLDRLLRDLQTILSDKLLGLYLYGSLVTGDFDNHLSDIDLLAALATDLTPSEQDAIRQMHAQIAADYPVWDNRIEVAYHTRRGLQSFRTERSPLGIISPGEPFHIIDAGDDWLMNWYFVQTYGIVLYGLPPAAVIAPISQQEFIDGTKAHILMWRDYVSDLSEWHGSQAYAILTMCRGMYTVRHGEHVSKKKAAAWAITAYPAWAFLIQCALLWRQAQHDQNAGYSAPIYLTRRFVAFMIGEMGKL
jgi:hypothetical protein